MTPETDPDFGRYDATDEAIDQALGFLRTAEPGAAFERRILNALKSRATAKSQPSLWPSFHAGIGLAAYATLAVLTLAGWLFVHGHSASQIRIAITAPRTHSVQQTPAFKAQEIQAAPKTLHLATGAPQHRPDRTAVSSAPTEAARLATNSAQPTSPDESALLADLHAPSHPAPPLPLSPQERALMAMLRRRNSVDLATLSDLNPSIRSAHATAEAADFRAFFNPPRPTQSGDTE